MKDSEKLKNQEDVHPSQALEKLIVVDSEQNVKTTGTGANNAVPRGESLIIKSSDDQDTEQ